MNILDASAELPLLLQALKMHFKNGLRERSLTWQGPAADGHRLQNAKCLTIPNKRKPSAAPFTLRDGIITTNSFFRPDLRLEFAPGLSCL